MALKSTDETCELETSKLFWPTRRGQKPVIPSSPMELTVLFRLRGALGASHAHTPHSHTMFQCPLLITLTIRSLDRGGGHFAHLDCRSGPPYTRGTESHAFIKIFWHARGRQGSSPNANSTTRQAYNGLACLPSSRWGIELERPLFPRICSKTASGRK